MLALCSCNQTPRVTFENRCSLMDPPLKHGVKHSLLDARMHFITPNVNWTISENEYGFVAGDPSLGYINAISLTERNYEGNWDWDQETNYLLKNLDDNPQVQVIESYFGQFQDKMAYETLVLENHQLNTQLAKLTYSFINEELKKSFVLSLVVQADSNYEHRICDLIPIAKTIELKN